MKLILIINLIFICVNSLIAQNETDTTIYKFFDSLITPPYFNYIKGNTETEKLLEFYKNNLKYPHEEDCEGKVYIGFVVEINDSLTNIRFIRDIPGCNSFNKEALRLINLMNRLWKHAIREGKKVRCEMIIPINFRLY